MNILGLNPAGYEAGNAAICAGRALPWLQETVNDDVWSAWAVTYRDVIIVNAQNQAVDVFNLTANDLSLPVNQETLKQKLRDAGAP